MVITDVLREVSNCFNGFNGIAVKFWKNVEAMRSWDDSEKNVVSWLLK